MTVGVYILGLLPRAKSGRRFFLVIRDRFTKLTQAIPLRLIDSYTVARSFAEEWVFKYGAPESVVTENGSQFTTELFFRVCQVMGIANAFTSTYHPHTNELTERYNRTILKMLRCYVGYHQGDWDEYVQVLTYAYNNGIQSSTNNTPFDLVLSRQPSDPAIFGYIEGTRKKDWAGRKDCVLQMAATAAGSRVELKKAQLKYKKSTAGCEEEMRKLKLATTSGCSSRTEKERIS